MDAELRVESSFSPLQAEYEPVILDLILFDGNCAG